MKARIITGIIFAVIAIILIVYVCIEWNKNGCGWKSLACMIAMYGSCLGGLWYSADQTIKEYQKEHKQK